MAPKAKGGKKGKKGGDLAEPEHDPDWERAVETGVWARPVHTLPDANIWPTWGALRERIITSCKEISITQSPSVRDAFTAEIVKLSPPLLAKWNIRGSENLLKFVLSPATSCPALLHLDLSFCKNLEYILIQSNSLTELRIHNCPRLEKALIHCPKLESVSAINCGALTTFMLWSGVITSLDMNNCPELTTVKLHCPALTKIDVPTVREPPGVAQKPAHPPISLMLKDNCREMAMLEAEAVEAGWKMTCDGSLIPVVHRPF